jgi:GntR family transcriptional regulator / MocR family aminotransferase
MFDVLLWHQAPVAARTILKRAVVIAIPPISLDRRRPLARQISEGLRAAIQSGRLKRNDRVPPTRTFARALGVSRQIIVAAYEELVASSHLYGRVGDGSYVACTMRHARAEPQVIVDPDGNTILVWSLQ